MARMSWRTRLLLRESAFTAIAFTAAVYSYYLIAVWGLQDMFVPGPLRDYLTSPAAHVELLVFGLLFGGLIGVVNRFSQIHGLRGRSVGGVVALRTSLYLVGFAAVAGVVILLFGTVILGWAPLLATFEGMTVRHGLSFGLWLVLAVLAINLALEVERVLGPGNLWRLFVGRYQRPREEERVFLFMDLEHSTATAEELGHTRYSEFLQECFRDLTQVVMEHHAAIYQYVGDEVVLSWPSSSAGGPEREAVQAFFSYRDTLASRAEVYRRRFGTAPDFRGAIDGGPVTVIEVGDVKREIVYHGDVLNTAARLLESCKTQRLCLLVSGSVHQALEEDGEFQPDWDGTLHLRGKKEPVEAFSIRHIDPRTGGGRRLPVPGPARSPSPFEDPTDGS